MESEVSRDESNLSPYLSARSRLPLCLPEDANMEMALAPESPKIEQQSQKTLVVEVVSLRPIDKFRRAVAKMPRFSKKETATPGKSRNVPKLGTEGIVRLDGGRTSLRLPTNRSQKTEQPMDLARENQALHERLREEAARYDRRLDTYKLAQQRQAVLVSRLQAKVMQYRERCSELEREMRNSIPAIDNVRSYRDSARDYQSMDLDSAIRALEQERSKSEKIMELNSTLREQLDDAQTSNETLSTDLQKLTSDWEKMRDEMNAKEDEWKEEEQMFNEYCSLEHGRMMSLWQDVAQVKRMFTDMKSSTQQDLNKLRGELSLASNDMVTTCSGLVNAVKRSTYSEEKQYENLLKENTTLQNKVS